MPMYKKSIDLFRHYLKNCCALLIHYLVLLAISLYVSLQVLTYIQRGVLPVDMVIDVGHSQRLDRCGSNAQQNLGSDQQQVHHVGVGSVATS